MRGPKIVALRTEMTLLLTQLSPSVVSGIHNTAFRSQYGMQSQATTINVCILSVSGPLSTVQAFIKLWPRLHKDTRIYSYCESRDDTYFSQ